MMILLQSRIVVSIPRSPNYSALKIKFDFEFVRHRKNSLCDVYIADLCAASLLSLPTASPLYNKVRHSLLRHRRCLDSQRQITPTAAVERPLPLLILYLSMGRGHYYCDTKNGHWHVTIEDSNDPSMCFEIDIAVENGEEEHCERHRRLPSSLSQLVIFTLFISSTHYMLPILMILCCRALFQEKTSSEDVSVEYSSRSRRGLGKFACKHVLLALFLSHLMGRWNLITERGINGTSGLGSSSLDQHPVPDVISSHEDNSSYEEASALDPQPTTRHLPDFMTSHHNTLSFVDEMTNDELTSYLFDHHYDYLSGRVDRALIYSNSASNGRMEAPERLARLEFIINNIEVENVNLIHTSFDFWMRRNELLMSVRSNVRGEEYTTDALSNSVVESFDEESLCYIRGGCGEEDGDIYNHEQDDESENDSRRRPGSSSDDDM
eukprot:scaffold29303_cov146-Skeletonema_marinoi.AAC.2